MREKINLESIHSNHKGIKGLFEKLLRRFKVVMHLVTMIPVYLLACLVLGICLVPGISVFRAVSAFTEHQAAWIQNISYGLSFAAGFFLYGISLVFLAPVINLLIIGRLKEWRGPYYSAESLKWFMRIGVSKAISVHSIKYESLSRGLISPDLG